MSKQTHIYINDNMTGNCAVVAFDSLSDAQAFADAFSGRADLMLQRLTKTEVQQWLSQGLEINNGYELFQPIGGK